MNGSGRPTPPEECTFVPGRDCWCATGLMFDDETRSCVPCETSYSCPIGAKPGQEWYGSAEKCTRSLADCECESYRDNNQQLVFPARDLETDSCVLTEDCSVKYDCPSNSSHRIRLNTCSDSFVESCRCDSGFLRDEIGEACVANVAECAQECPSNSKWRGLFHPTNAYCPNGLYFCICDEGFGPDYDSHTCLPAEEYCLKWTGFQCPTNSTNVKFKGYSSTCAWSFWDCECDDGFVKDSEAQRCVQPQDCTYACPPNTVHNDGLWCSSTFGSCTCADGFVKDWENEKCVSEQEQPSTCWSSFTCPGNATPKAESNNCPWSIWDCECGEGLKANGDTNSCIPDVPSCWSNFTCPDNASPKAESNNCPWSIWDCECGEGLKANGDTNSCIPDVPICWSSFSCPDNALPKAESNNCPWSIWDCACHPGYKLDAEQRACI